MPRNNVSLLINIDHIATVRNARGGSTPDPIAAARTCLRAGANGIVCHLREDRRHIRDADVRGLRHKLRTKLDLEMAATPEIIRIALRVKPDLVTLVPERRKELTTEGGLDVVRKQRSLKKTIERFHASNVPVSLFIDPRAGQVRMASEIGADIVELHTGAYADAPDAAKRRKELGRIREAAMLGSVLGLSIHAGHGLDYNNTRAVARIPHIREISIGYAVIAEALDLGLYDAVRRMVCLVRSARR